MSVCSGRQSALLLGFLIVCLCSLVGLFLRLKPHAMCKYSRIFLALNVPQCTTYFIYQCSFYISPVHARPRRQHKEPLFVAVAIIQHTCVLGIHVFSVEPPYNGGFFLR